MLAPPSASATTKPKANGKTSPTVVATGLDNPRHLSFGPGNSLYVAESGRGGDGPCFLGPEGDNVCFGKTGAITKVTLKAKHKPTQRRVVTGLPSLGGEGTGEAAIGPSDVLAESSKKLVFTLGLGADPSIRTTYRELAQLGTLRSTTIGKKGSNLIADLAKHEARNNPMHPEQHPDSNPVGFIRSGSTYVVADAGGNTVVSASAKGSKKATVTTLAVFQDQLAFAPPFLGLPEGTQIPAQAVPTSVTKGPDGALYVSQLTGFPFEKGSAKIYKVDKRGKVSVHASGLTNVTDLAFGPNGVLYAVQISSDGLLTGPMGSVVAIPKRGGATHTVVADNLFAPYGIAIKGKTAYVTTGSVAPGAGQVVAIPIR